MMAEARSSEVALAERNEELRAALSRLHDEVCTYLRRLDVSPEDLPVESPIRRAIDRARNLI